MKAATDSDTEYTAMNAPPPDRQLKRQRSSFQEAHLTISKWMSPKQIDAIIAGLSLTLASYFLHFVDLMMGVKAFPLFAPPLLASSVIFFGGPSPPPTKGFLVCTIGAWAIGFAGHFLMEDGPTAMCLVAGLCLIFFKISGFFFVPTLGVAVVILSDTSGAFYSPVTAFKWLLTPWLAGSAFMYLASHCVSVLRKNVRAALSKAKFKATLEDSSDEALKQIFTRYDTSGDGFLQAGELKFAWQVVTGIEMSEEEAQALVQSVDTDGNNEIDPDEFIQLVREEMA